MCNIAGYTGSKRAAPILIDMLRREQFFDGGCNTGIATVHEGKLYYAKVIGDVDDFLRETDAINFPGTFGIAHSRPGGSIQSHAHPFVDRNETLAAVLNGTWRDVNTPEFYEVSRSMMQAFMDRGFEIRSAVPGKGFGPLSNGMTYHNSELFALHTGDVIDKGNDIKNDIVRGMCEVMSAQPADIVMLAIHALLDGTINAARITRPMVVGLGDGESYVATTAFAFPEDVELRNIVPLPTASISQITPGALHITDAKIENVKIQEYDHGIAAKAYKLMDDLLKGQKDDPKSLYDMPFYTDWRGLWNEPAVDCKYVKEGGLLKPYAELSYEILWAFHCEGRLHMTIGEQFGRRIMKFWTD